MQQSAASSASASPSPNFASLLASLAGAAKKPVSAWGEERNDGLADDVVVLSYENALRAHSRYHAPDEPHTPVAAPEPGTVAKPQTAKRMAHAEPIRRVSPKPTEIAGPEPIRKSSPKFTEMAGSAPAKMSRSAHNKGHKKSSAAQKQKASVIASARKGTQKGNSFARMECVEMTPEAPRRSTSLVACNRRNSSVSLRLNEDESEQLRSRAEAAGLSVSAYLRSCIFEVESLRAQVKEAVAQMRQTTASSAPAPSFPAPNYAALGYAASSAPLPNYAASSVPMQNYAASSRPAQNDVAPESGATIEKKRSWILARLAQIRQHMRSGHSLANA
jgi:hypothetical protein